MPTPNTISSLGDVDKISELESSTLTPTEIKTGIESGKALGEKLAGLDSSGDAIDAAIDKVNGSMTTQLDANTNKISGANKNDIDLISLLFESGLTAQQIADAIKKSKDITMTAAQIDAAVTKVGLIQDVNSVISGLTATGAEIDNSVFNLPDRNSVLNARFQKSNIGEKYNPRTLGMPINYSLVSVGNILPASIEIIERNCDLTNNNKALKITHIKTTGVNPDFRVVSRVKIPSSKLGTTQLCRIVVVYEIDNMDWVNSTYAEFITNGVSNGGVYPTLVSETRVAGSIIVSVYEFNLTTTIHEINLWSRYRDNSSNNKTSSFYQYGITLDFYNTKRKTFEINSIDELNFIKQLMVKPEDRYKINTNMIENSLFINGIAGYTFAAGGANVVMPTYNINSVVQTPFNIGKSLEITHLYDGTIRTDLQVQYIIKVPEKLVGSVFDITYLYHTLHNSNSVFNYGYISLLDNNKVNIGNINPTKISSDSASGIWGKSVFTANITNTNVRYIMITARTQHDSVVIETTTSYLTGICCRFNNLTDLEYEYNMNDIIKPIVASNLNSNILSKNTDTYLSGNNIYKTTPSTKIQTWGDSLTAANYASILSGLFGGLRTVVNNGIGGESAVQITNRIKGFSLYTTGLVFDSGVKRLRARRATPYRLTEEAYRSEWIKFGATIANPSYIEFFNNGVLIGKSYDQITANCTTNGSTITSNGHAFRNGDIVYMLEDTVNRPIPMHRNKHYFVSNVTANTFSLSEFNGGSVMSFTAGSMTLLGDFYLDWDCTGQTINLTTRTKTDKDEDVIIIWSGVNNILDVAQTKTNIQEAIAHIKTFNKRFIVMTLLTNEAWINGTTEKNNQLAVNSWIKQTYPYNYVDAFGIIMANGNGSANDLADIANGITPRSLRGDGIHLTTAGYTLIANELYSFLNNNGW